MSVQLYIRRFYSLIALSSMQLVFLDSHADKEAGNYPGQPMQANEF